MRLGVLWQVATCRFDCLLLLRIEDEEILFVEATILVRVSLIEQGLGCCFNCFGKVVLLELGLVLLNQVCLLLFSWSAVRLQILREFLHKLHDFSGDFWLCWTGLVCLLGRFDHFGA